MSGSDANSGNAVMQRAIRRLGILETLFLLLAAVAALFAGALMAWLLGQGFGLPFRPTWAASALLLFLLPGGISYWRARREAAVERQGRGAEQNTREES